MPEKQPINNKKVVLFDMEEEDDNDEPQLIKPTEDAISLKALDNSDDDFLVPSRVKVIPPPEKGLIHSNSFEVEKEVLVSRLTKGERNNRIWLTSRKE